jgi:amino acid adenylation domain-containing protein
LNEKDELLTYFLEQEGIQRQKPRIVPPRSRFDPPGLSFAQERFWFLDQFESNRSVYNSCKVERLVGKLDFASLAASLKTVVRRHEVLRTTYPAVDGQPIQKISPTMTLPFPLENLRGVPANDRDSEVLRFAERESQCPFDLTKGPLIRAKVLQFSDEEHVLLLTLHQMIYDSWSVGVLFRELWTFYESFSRLREPSPGELPIQYADFAVWQREWLRGEVLESHIAYWKEQLGDSQPAADLPTDRSRPRLQSYHGRKRSIALPESLKAALKDLSRREGATLFMALLAAFKTLLHRYTAQDDLVVGCPVINRSLPEIENLIGSFVNTLVLRTDVSGNPTFRAVLSRVRDVCLSAYAHQDLPFEKLVEELQPQRDLARSPLFQTMFAFQNTPLPKLLLPDLKSESIEVDGGIAKFDLTFSLAEKDQGIAGYVEYNTDLFDHATIGRMIGHFKTLLEGIVADPDQRISDLPILTEAERNQLLLEWNDTKADYPKDRGIHKLFEEQAERTPDAIAVTFEAQQLTYRDLNTRANQLGHYLISLGVRPGKLVGICVGRSIEMVVGLLGILRAGGAYVPLDPEYPSERLAFMIRDAQVSVIVTQARFAEDRRWRMEDGHPQSSILDPRLTVVCLDHDWSLVRTQSPETPDSHWHSDSLAYVIYTSGSTGQPKGVQVSHRSVVNCLHSINRRLGFTGRDVLLAVTTISFDIAALELYLPLLVGGTVVVASREEAADGTALLRRLEECSATAMQATPSTWRLLLDAGWQGSEAFKIICGGDALSRDLANKLLARGTLWNLYGPTETTIWSTVRPVESGERSIPIGRPIANTRIYILDSRLKLVPIGVHGEIYVGGDGLALGYVNRPELNAEKFIPNPFSAEPGSRLYRTGDRARYLPDGNIEFIGRIDDQVKIRGHRIELGEVEATLIQHPAVRECVIVARARDSLLEQSLIGYVVPRQLPAPSGAELRGYLKEKLPEHMIPSVFVPLDDLPLTPNGKIDRNRLPPPEGERMLVVDQGFVEPRTEIEELVAQIWREMLKLDKIGVHHNFFDLGGHSLLATRVVARLRNNFDIDLALRKLFELPTVAALAEHIDELLQNQSGTTAPRIVPVARDRVLPASFSQQRLWFLRELDPESTAYNISAVFSIRGALNVSALAEAFDAIIARHEILRTTFDVIGGALAQKIQPSLGITLRIVDLESLSENAWKAAVREIALDEARQPFDLRKGPLLRTKLLQSDGERYCLLLNFDHSVLDGWSMGTFFKELGILYAAFAGGQPNPLAPLPLQFADYAVWQRERFCGDVSEAQLEYWKRQIGDRVLPLSLPTDYPRPARQTSRGIRKTLALSKQLSDSLKELSRREGVTPFMTLLGGFEILLSRHEGQNNIVIGATIAGRSRPEIEGLIGFFVNALPLRTDLSGNPTFLELLKRVREVCLGAYTHQDAPFERIVETINPRRDFSRNPLFQVMFNMADVSERVLQFAGCEVRKESFFDPEAKFDITLYAPEKDGVIELAIVYNADLFVESRIATMLDQFAYLLAQITEKPQARIGEYSLALPSTRALLPDPTESLDDRWEGAIHELFSRQARITPEKMAVIDADDTWTYRELDERSSQMANYLLANGIRPKDILAVYAHRSPSLVLTLLGILKAGAAFFILDPAYPPARLTDYLRIARPKGWIQMDGAGGLPEDLANYLETHDLTGRVKLPEGKQMVADVLSQQPQIAIEVIVVANDPAYVAFTSGSTGEPKGVVCRHGSITHFLPWQKEAFDLRDTDRFCLLSGLAYNHLHRDVFTPLALGATLYVPRGTVARDPERLTEWLRAHSISVLHLTPALGQLLLTAGIQSLPAVRRVLFGGDVLTAGLVAEIRRALPNAIIGSFYGATETQRAVGYYEIPTNFGKNRAHADRPLPLGHGIKDVQLVLLNRAEQLAGIGELAELYVRSPHLAEGYIGDEQLTAETFVQNPFTNDPKDRLYRTGELGRYLPDGDVEWAGRNDRRVNIRGFRVELEEIEAILKQHPIVKSAAVVMQEYEISAPENAQPETRNPKLDQRLVAYVVADETGDRIIDLIRAFLSTRLPDYMVPAHLIIIEELPLSPNGKVDYRALPPMEQFFSIPSSPLQSPRNEVETKLSVIFSRVLGREQVGIEENFFRLGGHSLLAAQTAARIREAFGVSLELRAFLESPTIAALAKEIEVRIKEGDKTRITHDPDREEIEL